MNDIQPKNLTQQLVHELGSAIVQEHYSETEGLPSEADICEQFSVSRSATREAVKMLTAKGLISSRPRQGIRILPKEQWNLFDTEVLQWILSGKLTLHTLRDFLQLRLGIEPEAARLAAVQADKNRIAAIGSALQRMHAAEKGGDDPRDADIAFHIAILMATNNLFYMQLRGFVESALRVSIRFTSQIKGATGDLTLHKAIYQAIADGDEHKARRLMCELQCQALKLIESELQTSNK